MQTLWRPREHFTRTAPQHDRHAPPRSRDRADHAQRCLPRTQENVLKSECSNIATQLGSEGADEQLIEQIAACFYADLLKLAEYRCDDKILSEDVVQEAFSTGIAKLHTFRGDAPLEHWLKKLVVTTCSRMRRGRKNNPHFNVPLDETAEPEEAPTQEASVLTKQRLGLIIQALSATDKLNRSLLLLHEGQERSIAALAAEFNLSADAVKSRLKRTRAALRDALMEFEGMKPA